MDNGLALIRLKFEMNLDSLVNAILRSVKQPKEPITLASMQYFENLSANLMLILLFYYSGFQNFQPRAILLRCGRLHSFYDRAGAWLGL